ncbi:HEAT repeat domain-containing protein [Myxococcota bacterium]|nr:HEAT repeat domain-containing protein [Myxococcota bacterium]
MSKTLLCPNFRCGERDIASTESLCPKCGAALCVGVHYRFLRALSQGGMGSTYMASDERFQGSRSERCVIKEIKSEHHDKDFAAMLQREAGGLLQLRHTGIPAYRDFFEDAPGGPPSRWFLVQEAIDGETLQARIQRGEVYSLEEALDIFVQVLDILQYLHELKDPETGKDAPVIHLDIKPDNLMRRASDGRIFLIDFGVSSEIRHTIQESKGAKASVFGYTMGYAPFEQTLGYAAPSSDLYALAMTFLVLLTGESPLALFDPIEQSPRFHRYVSLPTSLALLISRMLRVNLKERVPSARQALACLAWVREAIDGNHASLQKLVDALKLSQTLRGVLLPEESLDISPTQSAMDDLVLAKADTMDSSAQRKNLVLPKHTLSSQLPESGVVGSEVSSSPPQPIDADTKTSQIRLAAVLLIAPLLVLVFAIGWLGGRFSQPTETPHRSPPTSDKRSPSPTTPIASLPPKPPLRPFVPLIVPPTPPSSPSALEPTSLPSIVTSSSDPNVRSPTSPKVRASTTKSNPAFAHEKPIPAHLLEDLKPDYGIGVRIHALRALGEIPTQRSRWLLYQHIQEPNLAIKAAASDALASMGALAVDTLAQAMKLKDPITCRFAAYAIGKIGVPARRILPLLLVVAEQPDQNWLTLHAALEAIQRMRPSAQEVWPALYVISHSTSYWKVQKTIAEILSAAEVPVSHMEIEFRKTLLFKSLLYTNRTFSLIDHLGPYAFELLPMLQEILQRKDLHRLHYRTLDSIRSLGPRTLPFWEATFRTNEMYALAAIRAFDRFGAASLPSMRKLFQDEPNANTRKAIIYSARGMGKAALPFLQDAAKDKDPEVQELAERFVTQLSR